MRRIFLLLALLFSFSGASPAARADGQTGSPDVESVAAPEAGATAGAAPAPGSGLPQAPPPPRSLRAYWHLFGAYAIVWTLLFGYAISLGRRSGALERRIERLEGGGV